MKYRFFALFAGLLLSLPGVVSAEDSSVENNAASQKQVETPEKQLQEVELLQRVAAARSEVRAGKNGEWSKSADEKEPSAPLQSLKALGLCLGALFIIAHFLKKRARGRGVVSPGSSLQMIGRLSLTPKASVALLEVEGRKVLVGMGADIGGIVEISSEDNETVPLVTAEKESVQEMELVCEEDIRLSA